MFAESIRKQTARFEHTIAEMKQQKNSRKKNKQNLGQAHMRLLEGRLHANNLVLAKVGEI